MRVICLLFSETSAPILEIAEACYRWTPQIAIKPNQALFLEIGRCHRLYTEQGLILRIQSLLKRFQTRARIAIADDIFMSLAKSRYGREKKDLPLEVLIDVANPFHEDEKNKKIVLAMIEELKNLGLKNIGDFLKLPSHSLVSRFQGLSLILQRRLLKESDETSSLWPSFIPQEKIKESTDLSYHENCQTLEPLLFVIKGILNRIMARLTGRRERMTKARLIFELEKFSTVKNSKRTWTFEFPLSQGTAQGVLPLIQERLQWDLAHQPLESSVTKIEMEVLESAPGQYFQKHFFNKKEEEQEAWNSLIARLCEKLGRTCFVAEPVQNYKPEKAWQRSLHEIDFSEPDREYDIPLPERPLRLLQKPQPLTKQGEFLIEKEKKWEIQSWEGPERISGQWWGEEFLRDYFRIEAKSGEELWIFKIPGTQKIYLHGYFD